MIGNLGNIGMYEVKRIEDCDNLLEMDRKLDKWIFIIYISICNVVLLFHDILVRFQISKFMLSYFYFAIVLCRIIMSCCSLKAVRNTLIFSYADNLTTMNSYCFIIIKCQNHFFFAWSLISFTLAVGMVFNVWLSYVFRKMMCHHRWKDLASQIQLYVIKVQCTVV